MEKASSGPIAQRPPALLKPPACVGKLLIPQEELYKKNVLLVRGRFRPFTLLHNDMLMGAAQQFFCAPDQTPVRDTSLQALPHSAVFDECVYREDSTVLLELTTRSMMEVSRREGERMQADSNSPALLGRPAGQAVSVGLKNITAVQSV